MIILLLVVTLFHCFENWAYAAVKNSLGPLGAINHHLVVEITHLKQNVLICVHM